MADNSKKITTRSGEFTVSAFQHDRMMEIAKRHNVSISELFEDIEPELQDALNSELARRERQAFGPPLTPGRHRTGETDEMAQRLLIRIPDIDNKLAALERLIDIALSDTGQSRRVADFLLAWWNAQDCGKFDVTDLWSVDDAIANDMLDVCGIIRHLHGYPDSIGYKPVFQRLVKQWRADA